MNIRIGNDIRLNLTLKGIQNYNKANIKQMRCYFVNVTARDYKPDCCAITRRFPREPFPQFYTPTRHTLHTCGHPVYHVNPCYRKHDYAMYGPDEYHWWCGYKGFGPCPAHFAQCEHGCCGCKKNTKPVDSMCNDYTFLAPSYVMSEENRIQVYFPAQQLFMCGEYKLVIVLTVYESGWGHNNLHTYTIDRGIVFNLTDDENGISGDIVVDVDNNTILSTDVSQVETSHKDYNLTVGDVLNVGSSDRKNKEYKIYATVDGKRIEYSRDWKYDDLVFKSSNPNVVSVGTNTGELVAYEVGIAIITVMNSKDNTIAYKYNVIVENAPEEISVGLSTDDNVESGFAFGEVHSINLSNPSVTINIPNTRPCLLLVKTTIPLRAIDEKTPMKTDGVLCDDIMIPMNEGKQVGKYYFYYSKNAIAIDDSSISVRLKF